MADMPTIYPMRFPAVQAERRPSSIDDLLPSTYMGQPTPFTAQMQNVGKMLQAKQDDSDAASNAVLKFGPTVAPGQIAALNKFLFARGGQPYGGVMDPQNPGDTLQVPGGDTATPFNTGGQTSDASAAQVAAAQDIKEKTAAAQQAMAQQRLDQQASQFAQRTQDRAASLLQAKTIHDQNDLRVRQLTGQKIAMSAQKQQTLGLAMGYHRGANQAYGNANKTQSLIVQKEKEMATDFTLTPDAKAAKLQELQALHEQAASEAQRGQTLDAQATQLLDGMKPETAAPAAPTAAPQAAVGTFTNAGQNPRFPMAAYGTVNGVPGWYQKDAQGNKTKVE